MSRLHQQVRYLRTSDGLKMAWAEAGEGPVVVKAANWLSHLEADWDSPIWRHWIRLFSDHFRFVRYDERGCGMTDWNIGNLSLGRWVEDLEAVVDAAEIREPFALVGISQGAAVCLVYAVRHPERVSRLVLYGGYARGALLRGDADSQREYRAVVDLARVGWAKDNPAFRQIFTSRFIPEGTDEQVKWFNDLCRTTTSPAAAAALLEARAIVDVSELLAQVRTPTLVLHGRHDGVVPISQGRVLAAGIRDARFIELDSCNHILLGTEPAWERFCEAVLEFLGVEEPAHGEDPAFGELSPRERGILTLIAEGLSNAEIAERLSLSEKTVRNHVSNLFDKLGVWTRAQAIVFARDRGFKGAARS